MKYHFGYQFTDVSINLFDLHLTPHILRTAINDYLQDEFKFLNNAMEYATLYNSGNCKRGHKLTFQCLPSKDKKTAFWQAYFRTFYNNINEVWNFQVPFICRDIKCKVNLSTTNIFDKSTKIKCRPEVYLSSLGWSSGLNIKLIGENITDDQLVNFMQKLNARNDISELPFLLEGKNKSISELFSFFKDLLLTEVYKREIVPKTQPSINRYFVISLNQYTGPISTYKNMSPGDKAMLRNILFGQTNNAGQENTLQNTTQRLLYTQIDKEGYNFARTDFNYGTIIFLQRDAQHNTRKGGINCFHSNVKDFIMTIFLLCHFYKKTQNDNTALILKMRENIRRVLQSIPVEYEKNQICTSFYTKDTGYSLLKEITNNGQGNK